MQVGSYYAQFGMKLDTGALRSTQAYLKTVERQLANFQRRVTKTQVIPLRFTVDRKAVQAQIQSAITRVAKGVRVPIKAFTINSPSLVKSVNKAFAQRQSGRGGVIIDARLSQSSLAAMRAQVRNSLQNMPINATIRANVIGRAGARQPAAGGQSSGSGSRAARQTNPNHNPMMVGGGVGAFMRYGAFALPFVGGVMGLNAYSNLAQQYRAQETGLSFAASLATDKSKDVGYYRNYLHEIGDITGMKESLLSSDFHQMLAGSAGTDMETHLEEGFLGLTQYASILGLSNENMRLVMRGVTQMIGKGKIQA